VEIAINNGVCDEVNRKNLQKMTAPARFFAMRSETRPRQDHARPQWSKFPAGS
jgi:hypothetical protein